MQYSILMRLKYIGNNYVLTLVTKGNSFRLASVHNYTQQKRETHTLTFPNFLANNNKSTDSYMHDQR